MSEQRIWLVTGAGRGLGTAITRAATGPATPWWRPAATPAGRQLQGRLLRGSQSDEFRSQVETVLFGSVNVARAALPVMRRQRSGLLIQISSTAGIVGGAFISAYAAAKFGVEGWFESLAPELEPFGIPYPARRAGVPPY